MTDLVECPECWRVRPWINGLSVEAGDPIDEYWCPVCGAETPLELCRLVEPLA